VGVARSLDWEADEARGHLEQADLEEASGERRRLRSWKAWRAVLYHETGEAGMTDDAPDMITRCYEPAP
ncbi:MAG: hypothetical protein Q8S13_05870, partial [Dehalococcoidia bacterium]|nr:hypothetical protein [Dehalococcoidia bacterium]